MSHIRGLRVGGLCCGCCFLYVNLGVQGLIITVCLYSEAIKRVKVLIAILVISMAVDLVACMFVMFLLRY